LVGRRDVSPYVVLVVMCVGYFLVLLDVTIVNVALPSIASGIGAGVTGLQWIVDGYALALASLMLAGGTIVTSTVIGVSSWRAWWSSGSDRLAARWSAASGR
jgi:MFS family permease